MKGKSPASARSPLKGRRASGRPRPVGDLTIAGRRHRDRAGPRDDRQPHRVV